MRKGEINETTIRQSADKAAGKFNGGGDNSHEAAQAVLLKVLKGES